jgi:hypothetical protein
MFEGNVRLTPFQQQESMHFKAAKKNAHGNASILNSGILNDHIEH